MAIDDRERKTRRGGRAGDICAARGHWVATTVRLCAVETFACGDVVAQVTLPRRVGARVPGAAAEELRLHDARSRRADRERDLVDVLRAVRVQRVGDAGDRVRADRRRALPDGAGRNGVRGGRGLAGDPAASSAPMTRPTATKRLMAGATPRPAAEPQAQRLRSCPGLVRVDEAVVLDEVDVRLVVCEMQDHAAELLGDLDETFHRRDRDGGKLEPARRCGDRDDQLAELLLDSSRTLRGRRPRAWRRPASRRSSAAMPPIAATRRASVTGSLNLRSETVFATVTGPEPEVDCVSSGRARRAGRGAGLKLELVRVEQEAELRAEALRDLVARDRAVHAHLRLQRQRVGPGSDVAERADLVEQALHLAKVERRR